VDTVRGSRESEANGEQAWLASLELRTPNLAVQTGLGKALGLTELAASAFVDAARAESIDPAVGQASGVSLAGAGLGLKLRLAERADGQLDVAWPLRLSANTPNRQARLHARFALRF